MANSTEYEEAYREGRAGNLWGSEMLARHPNWTGTHGAIDGFTAGHDRFRERRDRDERIDAELARVTGPNGEFEYNETPDSLIEEMI